MVGCGGSTARDEPPSSGSESAAVGREEAVELARDAAAAAGYLRDQYEASGAELMPLTSAVAVPEAAAGLRINLNTAYTRLRTARQRFERAVHRLRAAERGHEGGGDHE